MSLKSAIFFSVSVSFLASMLWSCKHEPVIGDDSGIIVPPDTSGTGGGGTDTTGSSGVPCDPATVYFDQQVLPLLRSNCAVSGCHDAQTAEEGIVLTTFENVTRTAEVEPYDPDDNDLIERITENDSDKRMPPPPAPALTPEQIQLITDWILQGAKDLECDPDLQGCDTENVSFTDFVKPVIDTWCKGCHSGPTPNAGINLDGYDNISAVALSGRLYGAISWQSGFVNMPYNGNKLPDCTIDKIKSWIDSGTPDN